MMPLKKLADNQFLRFALTGGVAALVNLASRYLLNHYMGFEIAVALAYLLGMLTAYALSRLFVFSASGRGVRSELARFTIVNAVALVQVWVISVGLANLVFPPIGFTWHANDIAHLIGVISPVVTSYFGHRYYSFSSR